MKKYRFRYLRNCIFWMLMFLFSFCSSFNSSLATGIGSALSLDGDGDEVRVEHSQSLVMLPRNKC